MALRRCLLVLIVTLASETHLLGFERAVPGTITPVLTIRVYNIAQLDRADLDEARREVSRMFAYAGLRLHWVEGRDLSPEVPEAAVELLIRLVPGTLVPKPDVCGVAHSEVRPGRMATIYAGCIEGHLQRVRRKAHMNQRSTHLLLGRRSLVLAHVIVHEIGHLLLGGAHGAGVMGEHLTARAVGRVLRSKLLFSPEDAVKLRAALLERSAVEVAGLR
jgi:hypothetical protein